MNKNDSSIIETILEDQGFERADSEDTADIYIINTCTVRAHAENRALAYVSGLRQWRQKGKRVLAMVGCLAEEKADEISRKLSFVDIILGPDSYRQIGAHIMQVIERETKIVDRKLDGETYCGVFPKTPQVASFVSIIRGCSNYCSYCIVPYVRGKARSRPPEDIGREIEHLVQCGVKDITLLGQNVNEYCYESTDFVHLLEKVSSITGLLRLRFLTSHPKDFAKKTVDVVKAQSNICEWFHLPLQSGNDRILQLMNRKYTVSDYRSLIDHIRREIPEARITTDVIVGFPSEAEEEFQNTVSLIKEIRFDDAYMYRYSTRTGTSASRLKPLDEPVIKRRLSELISIQNTITRERTEAMMGKQYEILIEGPARGNASRGKTRGNKDVVVEQRLAPGTIVNVSITQVKGHTPIGEITTHDTLIAEHSH